MNQGKLAEEYEILLDNIAWLRKHHGLSKQEMAKFLKLGVKSIDQIESGHLPPRMGINSLFQIWKQFGVSLSDQFEKRLGEREGE